MTESLAISVPSPEELEGHAKTVAALGSVVGGAWLVWSRWWRRYKARKLQRELESRAVRYLLDAMRHSLNVIVPGDARRLMNSDELLRQKLLIDEVRDQLWVADGHESQRAAQEAATEIIKVITRTQAIRMKQERRVGGE